MISTAASERQVLPKCVLKLHYWMDTAETKIFQKLKMSVRNASRSGLVNLLTPQEYLGSRNRFVTT